MLNEIKIKGIKPTDKVFKHQERYVKIRLLKKEVTSENKINGPLAIVLQLSGSVCDDKGKAVSRNGGTFCICPHTVTIPVSTLRTEKKEFVKILEEALEPLISQTLHWHKNLSNLEEIFEDWSGVNAWNIKPSK